MKTPKSGAPMRGSDGPCGCRYAGIRCCSARPTRCSSAPPPSRPPYGMQSSSDAAATAPVAHERETAMTGRRLAPPPAGEVSAFSSYRRSVSTSRKRSAAGRRPPAAHAPLSTILTNQFALSSFNFERSSARYTVSSFQKSVGMCTRGRGGGRGLTSAASSGDVYVASSAVTAMSGSALDRWWRM